MAKYFQFDKMIKYLFKNNTSFEKKLQGFPEDDDTNERPLPLKELQRESQRREVKAKISELGFFHQELKKMQEERRKKKRHEDVVRLTEHITEGITDLFSTINSLEQLLVETKLMEEFKGNLAKEKESAEILREVEKEESERIKKSQYGLGDSKGKSIMGEGTSELSNISLSHT